MSPSGHDIPAIQRLIPSHGAGVDVLRVEELANHSRGEGNGINGDVQSARLAFFLTDAAVFSVVVEERDVSFTRVGGGEDASVVLPADVGGFAIREVCELVFPAAEDPDWMAVFAVYESEEGEVTAGDEVVAVISLSVSAVLAKWFRVSGHLI